MTSTATPSSDGSEAARHDHDADEIRDVDVVDGDAVLPDADEAPESDELKPGDPPAGAPAEGDPAKKSAVAPPVPAHGEMASPEQIREAAQSAEEEDAEA